MSVELIGIIAATIALGTAMLASTRSIRQDVRDQRSELLDRMTAMESNLRADMKATENNLRAETKALREETRASDAGLSADMKAMGSELRDDNTTLDGGLRGEIRALREEMSASDAGLREEIRASNNNLRTEMQAGFKDLSERVTNVGDRMSKVEGIIEGMFWSGRNQPPEKPREGAA